MRCQRFRRLLGKRLQTIEVEYTAVCCQRLRSVSREACEPPEVKISTVLCKNSRDIGRELCHCIETQRLGSRVESDQNLRDIDVERACESGKEMNQKSAGWRCGLPISPPKSMHETTETATESRQASNSVALMLRVAVETCTSIGLQHGGEIRLASRSSSLLLSPGCVVGVDVGS